MAATTGSTDSLLNTLRMEREIFWLQRSKLPPAEIQQLWTRRASEISSILDATSLPDRSTPHDAQSSPSASYTPPAMAKQRSDQSYLPRLDRVQNISHGSMPMSRKRSNSSEEGPCPVSNQYPYFSTSIPHWQAGNNAPFAPFSINTVPTSENPSKLQRTHSGRRPLAQVSEIIEYDNPGDYIKANGSFNTLSSTVAIPRLIPLQRPQGYPDSQSQHSPLSNKYALSQQPASPTSSALTDGVTLSDAMSRSESEFVVGGIDLLRIHSRQSEIPSYNTSDFLLSLDSKLSSTAVKTRNVDFPESSQSFSNVSTHAAGVLHGDTLQASSVPLVATAPVSSSVVEDLAMKRTTSNESNDSSRNRASRRRQEQLLQSKRPIASKRSEVELATLIRSSGSDHQMIRIPSQDGSLKDVIALPKTAYNRPTKEKVKCKKCNEHPDGFRGDHELRRHQERKHSASRKVWICIDNSPDKKRLANCNKCRARKKYGAYYNAAAHLRRVHFNPIPKGRKSKSNAGEKRGGKGGGDEPSMEFLKNWMEEVDEVGLNATLTQEHEGDIDDDEDQAGSEEEDNERHEDHHNGLAELVASTTPHSATFPNASAPTSPNIFTSSALQGYDPTHISQYAPPANDFNPLIETGMSETIFDDSLLFDFDLALGMFNSRTFSYDPL